MYTVVPAASHDHCLVVCLDLDSGQPLAVAPVQAAPEGISPMHHPDAGLACPKGKDRTQLGPGGSARRASFQVGCASKFSMAAGMTGSSWMWIHPVRRSSPRAWWRAASRAILPQPGYCQVHRTSTGRVLGLQCILRWQHDRERGPRGGGTFVAVDRRGRIADLDQYKATYLVPAEHGTWLAVTPTTTQHCKIMRGDEEIPGQIALW